MARKRTPLAGICILFILCYYTYVYEFLYNGLQSGCKLLAYCVAFHVLYSLALGMFLAAACDRKWMVPERYRIPADVFGQLRRAYLHEEDALLAPMCAERGIALRMRTRDGVMRVCYRCKHLKPDRAYHCRRCGVCVMRMDHHCYFLNTCIGASNMKYFVYLNVYTALLNCFCAGTQLEHVVRAMVAGSDVGMRITYLMMAAIVMLMLAATCATLAAISCETMARNTSMVELKHPPLFDPPTPALSYDKGRWRNMVEHCGPNLALWLLPCNFAPADARYELVPAPDDAPEGDEEAYLQIELERGPGPIHTL